MSSTKRSDVRIYRWLTLLGGAPLLAAMVIDTAAVIGRHLRMPLHGSIELVQSMLAISGATAMLVATLAGTHAAVSLLLDRLPERHRNWIVRASDSLSAVYFALLVAGGAWLAGDMWPGYEQSELLGLPFKPLRIATCLGLTGIAAVYVGRAIRRGRQ